MKQQRKPGRPRSDNAKSAAERMREYRARKRAAGMKSVVAWTPKNPATQEIYSDHRLLEARSLALHTLAARKIDADPALLRIATQNLKRWRARSGDGAPAYLAEWEQILRKPWAAVAAFMTSLSADATRLRQSSPFAGVLSAAERTSIYDAFRA